LRLLRESENRQTLRIAANIGKAAKRTAADIEGHSTAAKFGQPGRLSGNKASFH
jgi:hypothetical protein